MIKVLIVDDEPFIRQGLRILIDWNEFGYEITDEASNGKEALKLLKKEKYDLVIVDIKMPELNGLELIEYVKVNKVSEAKFIILSGFYEFEYAQKAIRFHVIDYLLKPIIKEDLIRILSKTKDEFMERKEDNIKKENMSRILFDRNLFCLLCGKYDESNLSNVKKYLSSTKDLRYVLIELDSLDEKFYALSDTDKNKEQKVLYEKLKSLLGLNKYHVMMEIKKHEISYEVGLIYAKSFADKRGITESEYMNQLVCLLKKELKYKVVVYIGQRVDEIDQISISVKSAVIAKSFQTFHNDKDISYYEETLEKKSSLYGMDKNIIESLIRAAEENDRERIETLIDKIYEDFKKYNVDPDIINLNIDYLLYCLIHLANELDPDSDQEEVLENIRKCAFNQIAVRGSAIHFKKFVVEFAGYLSQLRQNTSRGILGFIEKDIEEHYMDNLSLKSFGETYFINSAYLGQIFKKKFQVSFKDYLNNYRIERAAELLIRTDHKIYIIAELVGYNNLDYFTNKFVSIKGKTPLQYRRKFRNHF